jgi:hypothetical protein
VVVVVVVVVVVADSTRVIAITAVRCCVPFVRPYPYRIGRVRGCDVRGP